MTVYMPDEPADTGYGQTMFRRVQDVMAAGGMASSTWGKKGRKRCAGSIHSPQDIRQELTNHYFRMPIRVADVHRSSPIPDSPYR